MRRCVVWALAVIVSFVATYGALAYVNKDDDRPRCTVVGDYIPPKPEGWTGCPP